MPFQVNDQVVHPRHGVGRVVRLVSREFQPGAVRMYYEIALANGTIWVPVEERTGGLRQLTRKDEMGRYRGLLKSRPRPLSSDHRQRQLEIMDRLQPGTLRARCEVVRDLAAMGWGKPLNEGSAALLRSVNDVLQEEWAAACGLPLSSAAQEVQDLLQEGRRAHNKPGPELPGR